MFLAAFKIVGVGLYLELDQLLKFSPFLNSLIMGIIISDKLFLFALIISKVLSSFIVIVF